MLMLSHKLWDNIGKTPIFAFRPTRTIMQTDTYEYWGLSTDGKTPILCDQTQKQYTQDLLDAIPGGKLQLGLD